MEAGVPKLYYPRHYENGTLYVVEVQKTRTGVKTAGKSLPGAETEVTATAIVTVKPRPYSFADFDILAVNMHPSSGNWRSFRYTVASWLLPRPSDASIIEIFQPVAATPNEVWTDDLPTCLQWFQLAEKRRRPLVELLHLKKNKTQGKVACLESQNRRAKSEGPRPQM